MGIIYNNNIERYQTQSVYNKEKKRWECIYCRDAVGHKYIATSHDHTDYSYEVCSCSGAKANGIPESKLN